MKKFFIFVSLVTVIFLFSGCSKNTTETLKFASWGSKSEIEILKPVLKEFEKENPDIKLEFMHIPQNYFQKIHLLFASNSAPDVIFINNLYLPIYAKSNLLENLKPHFENELNKFYEKPLKALSYSSDNELFAIPRDVSTLVVYYNKDLFDKQKIAYPNENWTLQDFLITAQKLTNKNSGTWGVSYETDIMFWSPFLLSEGDYIFDENGNFTNQKFEELNSFKFYTDLVNKYHVAPRKSESASLTMAQLFLNEKIAMHISGRWLTPKYRSEAKFNWDVITFPNGKNGSVVDCNASGWAISKTSKQKNKAIRLIKYLSSKENIEKYTASGLIVPARIDVANSTIFLNGKPENSKAFLDSIEKSRANITNENYQKITDKLNQQLEKYLNKI